MNNCNSLYDNWILSTVGDVTLPIEKVYPKDNPIDQFIYIDISSIDNRLHKIINPKEYLGIDAPSRARQLVKTKDIVFSTVRTYLENIAMVPEKYNNQVASTGFSVLRANEKIIPQYLFYFTLSKNFIEKLGLHQRGTSYPAVRDRDVKSQHIPLPPIKEQDSIVAKIEELFSQLDAGVAGLKRVQELLKQYRASVLKAAFEGRLVPQDPNDEPAEEMLRRMGIEPSDNDDFNLIPKGWKRAYIDDVGEIVTGRTPSKKDTTNYGSYMPFVKPPDLIDGLIVDAQDNVSEKGSKLARILPENSVLVSCIGNIGKTGINKIPIVFNQQINAVIFHDVLLPRFGLYYFQSNRAREWLNSHSSATTIAIINKSKFSKLPILVPPIEEQERIVKEIEKRLSIADELEQSVYYNQMRTTRIRQSILKSAFEGKLNQHNNNFEFDIRIPKDDNPTTKIPEQRTLL
jgi:type I restriction enzyme S subunit